MPPTTTENPQDTASFTPQVGTADSNPPEKPTSEDLLRECENYDRLIGELEHRDPTAEDFRELEKHEVSCASGRHSEEGVEKALGLNPGALRNGSPQNGLRSPREVVDALIEEHLKAPA